MDRQKRGPGRPPLEITRTDPRVPIDVRRSTRRKLHELRKRLNQTEKKHTLDDVIIYLLSFIPGNV
jgi:hypothetical protein